MAFISVPLNPIQAATPGTDPEPYIIQWNPITDAYEYVPNPASNDTNATIDSYSFNLIGKCNPVAAAGATGPSREDWLEVLEPGLSPELEIVWTVENPFEVQVTMDTTGLIKVANCDGALWDSLLLLTMLVSIQLMLMLAIGQYGMMIRKLRSSFNFQHRGCHI